MGFFKELKKDLTQTTGDFMENDTEFSYNGEEAMNISDDMMVNTLEDNSINEEYFNEAIENSNMADEDALPKEDTLEEDFSKALANIDNNINDAVGDDGQNDSDETAIISKSVVITGDIQTKGSLVISGSIYGNVKCEGKITLTGTVKGNIDSYSLIAENARVDGNIECRGQAKIGMDTVVMGNVNATSAVFSGAVKGDIDVHGPVIMDTSAVIMGNIKSKLVQINNGAVVEGYCSQCYSDNSPEKYFNEN